jgi:secretion/DNA translocation related TadE-like protein
VTGRVGRDAGSGTLWVVGLVALVGTLAGVVLLLGAVAVARHRAATAADLAALAAAARLPLEPAAACPAARRVAVAHGARLASCGTPDGVVADVTVALDLARVLPNRWARLPPLTVSARAGPPAAP